jgi:hypothetical protein
MVTFGRHSRGHPNRNMPHKISKQHYCIALQIQVELSNSIIATLKQQLNYLLFESQYKNFERNFKLSDRWYMNFA